MTCPRAHKRKTQITGLSVPCSLDSQRAASVFGCPPVLGGGPKAKRTWYLYLSSESLNSKCHLSPKNAIKYHLLHRTFGK